jgi:type II secretory pathway component PulF
MSDQHLVQWFRQMAVLIHCGIPTTRALEACAKQTSDSRMRAATTVVLAELRVGQRMSEALRQAGLPFSALHCGAVEVGERQGDMAQVFERLASHAEEASRVRRRLLSALTYPALVISFSLGCLYMLVRFLAPVLSEVGRQLGEEPSGVSRLLLGLGQLFEAESLMLALAAILVFSVRGLWRYLWSRHRQRTEQALLACPLLGKIMRLSILIRICRTLEMMIGAGLPLTESMTLAARCCGSEHYAQTALHPAVKRVQRGESIRRSLQGAPGIPPSFIGMVLAGEESGRLEESFHHLARLYEVELVTAIDSFLAALEPISIALVGSIVLSVLLVVFVPLSRLVTIV